MEAAVKLKDKTLQQVLDGSGIKMQVWTCKTLWQDVTAMIWKNNRMEKSHSWTTFQFHKHV
jgi:hypothetical protein